MTHNTMERMAELIALGQGGDRDGARAGLEHLWDASKDADPVTRCGLAHSLADVQDSPQAELKWDLRALTSVLSASDSEVGALGMAQGVAGLMPSLHLNLADVYRRLGWLEVAKGHALQARGSLAAVESNPYFDTIAEAIERVLTKAGAGHTD
ncbi:MAG: hypothetical protein PVG83_06060 [Acidimicrobiia bacterium]|jgi:hypothetical protein